MVMSGNAHAQLIGRRLAEARKDIADAYYNLGIAYSLGQDGVDPDLIQAHMWFNLSAMAGKREAQEDRASVAADMSTTEIAEAQRQARAWLAGGVTQQAA